MKEKNLLVLNLITIIGMTLYAIGIYLEIEILKKTWGNSAINLSIQFLGPIFGLFLVTLIEILILFTSFLFSKIKGITIALNVFLCWFWILSLYQCAVNSFLSFNNLPNEPINQFFKYIWPNFWYPMKELVFILISISFTLLWLKKKDYIKLTKLDLFLIIMLSTIMWSATAYSQINLINIGSNVYS